MINQTTTQAIQRNILTIIDYQKVMRIKFDVYGDYINNTIVICAPMKYVLDLEKFITGFLGIKNLNKRYGIDVLLKVKKDEDNEKGRGSRVCENLGGSDPEGTTRPDINTNSWLHV